MEPAPSLPGAMGTSPPATAAAEPPDEPPAVRCGSHGLRVGGARSVSTNGKMASSDVLSFPVMTMPARRTDLLVTSSTGERMCRHAREPIWAGKPAVKCRSLSPVGSPHSRPRGARGSRLRSRSSMPAARSARSALTCTKAPSAPSRAAMRSR
jgi:hypothetical protein